MTRRGCRGWTTSRARAGPRKVDHRRDHRGDVDAAAEEARGDALVVPAAGRAPEDRQRARWRKAWRDYGVQPWRVGDVQVLHRPGAGREGHRRRRAVPGAAGERDRAVRGREVPDPGLGPDRADAADATGPARAAHPRLRPARHHHPVRRAGDRDRQGHRALQAAAPPPGVPARSSNRSPAPTPTTASCTW